MAQRLLDILPYKAKFPIVGALFLPLLARTVLPLFKVQLTPIALLLPFVVGGTLGFLTGFLLDKYLRTLTHLQGLNSQLRKEIQERARGESWYSALFEKNHSIILLIDPEEGRIVDANPTACQFYGFSREELKEMNIAEINTLSPESIRREMSLARQEKRRHFNFNHRLASGVIKEVRVHSGAIKIDGVTYLLSVVEDITELKELRGIIPICSVCKQIRDDKGYWSQVESYVAKHSEADFSHSICPTCAENLYPEVFPLVKEYKENSDL